MPKRKKSKKNTKVNFNITSNPRVQPKPYASLHFNSGDINVSNVDMRPVTISVRVSGSHTGGATANALTFVETDYSIANLGSRAVAFGDLFSFYRIVGIHYKGSMSSSMNTTQNQYNNNVWYVAFPLLPKSTFTAPTTIAQFCDFPYLVWDTDLHSIKKSIGRKALLESMPYKWLKTTQTGSIPDDEYIQFCHEICNLSLLTSTTASQLMEIFEIEIEFSGAMDPALNPLLPSFMKPRASSIEILDEGKEIDFSTQTNEEKKSNSIIIVNKYGRRVNTK